MVIGLNHAGVVVKDLEKAVAFYRDVIGLEVMERLDRTGPEIDQVVGYENSRLLIAKMNAPGEDHLVELIQYASPEPLQRHSEERSQIGASHIAFFVDDINDKFNAIVAAGGVQLNPPTSYPDGRIVCYLQDPDRNWVELIQPV